MPGTMATKRGSLPQKGISRPRTLTRDPVLSRVDMSRAGRNSDPGVATPSTPAKRHLDEIGESESSGTDEMPTKQGNSESNTIRVKTRPANKKVKRAKANASFDNGHNAKNATTGVDHRKPTVDGDKVAKNRNEVNMVDATMTDIDQENASTAGDPVNQKSDKADIPDIIKNASPQSADLDADLPPEDPNKSHGPGPKRTVLTGGVDMETKPQLFRNVKGAVETFEAFDKLDVGIPLKKLTYLAYNQRSY